MDHMWHWLAPVATINDKNRHAVESALLIQAGIIIAESAPADENHLHELMYMTYQSLLRDIPFYWFKNSRVSDAMSLNYKGAKEQVCNG